MKAKSPVLTCLALFGLLTVATAEVLYSQQSAGDGAGYAAQNDTSGVFGNFATVYDNFTLANDATITSVDWQGLFYNPPQHANIAGFTISFWADTANAPGSLLASNFVVGNAGEALVVGSIYSYSASIAAFVANAGTQYWLSIQPDVAYPPQWAWTRAISADSVLYQDFQGSLSLQRDDVAFTLNGQTGSVVPSVPDSGVTFAYCGLALAGLAMVRRRFIR